MTPSLLSPVPGYGESCSVGQKLLLWKVFKQESVSPLENLILNKQNSILCRVGVGSKGRWGVHILILEYYFLWQVFQSLQSPLCYHLFIHLSVY